MVKKAQYKIQQLSFMILGVFFFFALVGMLFLSWQSKGITQSAENLQQEKTLSLLKVIADSTELNCEKSDDWCLDKDKLLIFSKKSQAYSNLWQIASIEVVELFPATSSQIKCPEKDCNYYKIFDSNQQNKQTFGAYVTICEQKQRNYEICNFGQLIIGVKLNE